VTGTPWRARVAPGATLRLAAYGGQTGGNQFASGNNVFNSTTSYFDDQNGTSFATPIVAGGAALLIDAAKARAPATLTALDGRVLKAVLMNSASKTSGWTNGATTQDGVFVTTRAVDNAAGAGRLNLDAAFTQYLGGTFDLPGITGGSVAPVGCVAST
jgi:subtilisin family serine protease